MDEEHPEVLEGEIPPSEYIHEEGDPPKMDPEMCDEYDHQQQYDEKMEKPIISGPLRWNKVINSQGSTPRPRHGHRAVAIKELMLVFGGGNEGIVDELHVYNTATNQWFMPSVRGDVPSGSAAFGMICNKLNVYTFGGMIEYGRYSNDLYELQTSRWEWKKLRPRAPKSGMPSPCPRLGHTFCIDSNQICYVFGGLGNMSTDLKNNIPKYLDDLYIIDLKASSNDLQWDMPNVSGRIPCGRESHSAAIHESSTGQRFMIVFGGMNGNRLGDLWLLNLDTFTWNELVATGIPPLPRSLHTANIVDGRMYIYGGWVPLQADPLIDETILDKEWKCTHTLAILNIDRMAWEQSDSGFDSDTHEIPRARAGHSSVVINKRVWVWSGRDGYRKAWNNQVCCKDMWFLEISAPDFLEKVQLIRAQTSALEITWSDVSNAEGYLVQLQKQGLKEEPTARLGAGKNPSRVLPRPGAIGGSPQVMKVVRAGVSGGPPQVLRVVKQTGSPNMKPGTKTIIITKNANGGTQQKLVYTPERSKQQSTSDESSVLASSGTTYATPAPANDESALPQNLFDEGSADESTKDPSSESSRVLSAAESHPREPESKISDDQAPTTSMPAHTQAQKTSETNPDGGHKVDSEEWCDVGIIKGNKCTISHYFLPGPISLETSYGNDIGMTLNACDVTYTPRAELEPGTAYKFRVAGLNHVGRGPWSDTASFKTCLPGFPGAPSSIKITKGQDGAHVQWEPPQNAAGRISEYSVYLAVRNNSGSDSQLAFMRVYVGNEAQCTVLQNNLNNAFVDTSSKPAIIFRIAARNEKGYGPATQVRWLQEHGNRPQAQAQPARYPVGSTVHAGGQGHPQNYQYSQYSAMKRPRMD